MQPLKRGASLAWSPLMGTLRELVADAGALRVIVTPFASTPAVASLLKDADAEELENLRVVCRWSPADIVSGIADLSLFPFLRDRGVALFLHPRIHLKLYVFTNNLAFHSSANATGKGLGVGGESNIEVGATVELGTEDWDHLYELFAKAVAVDDAVYDKVLAYKEAHGKEAAEEPLPTLELTPEADGEPYSILALPACPTPEQFSQWHAAPNTIPPADIAAYMHDVGLYAVPKGISQKQCIVCVRRAFRASSFIQDIVALIQEERSASFGRVKAWLQANCSDRPTPYRWELSANTRVLYDWLACFYDEITWDRPKHSMVIRWTGRP